MRSSEILVVYVAHEYPARSQTFVVSEATALREAGHDVLLYPMQRVRPTDCTEGWVLHWTGSFSPSVLPQLVIALARAVARLGQILEQLRQPPRTLRQRLKFGKALLLGCALAALVEANRHGRPVHLHAHFFGLMSEVALLTRLMLPTDTTVSITGHAGDVANPTSTARLVHESESAEVVICASEFVQAALKRTGSSADTQVVHCAVGRQDRSVALRRAEEPLRAVLVARLVEKKGVDDCLRACHLLADASDVDLVLKVIGDGPERDDLARLRQSLRIQQNVHLLGAQPSARVLTILAQDCDVFVLPCKVASDGDADGIPVALMEAMSFAIPVVTTPVSGITELVTDGETGFIVPPGDPAAIAESLTRIAAQPEFARAVGLRGQEYVRRRFSRVSEAAALWETMCSVRQRAGIGNEPRQVRSKPTLRRRPWQSST